MFSQCTERINKPIELSNRSKGFALGNTLG